jgi:predicted DNA-binding transcriptional regulator AlpA
MSHGDELIPDPQVCERYSIVSMTLWRWDHDQTLHFPKPVRIRRRKYRKLAELVAWERAQARASRRATGQETFSRAEAKKCECFHGTICQKKASAAVA